MSAKTHSDSTNTKPEPSEDELADLMFKALAAKPRREILALLATGVGDDDACWSEDAVCACDLVDRLGLGAPTVSHHMKVLIDAGLVTAEKRGLWVHYQLRQDGVQRLLKTLGAMTGCC